MKIAIALAALLALSVPASAQNTTDSYEFMLAKIAAEEGRYDEAINRLDKLIEQQPQDAVLRYERAMMLIDSRRPERAESDLRLATKNAPDFYDAHRALARLLLDKGSNDRKVIDEVVTHLDAAFRLNNDDLSAGAMLAQLLMSLDRVAEAEKILSTVAERAPDHRQVNLMYAQVLTKLGKIAESKKYLERTLAADPTYTPAVVQLIGIYENEKNWRRAAELLNVLIEENPTDLDLVRQQALFFLRAGDAAGAKAGFEKILAAEPGDKRAQFYFAESLSDLGQNADAEKLYRELLATDPDDADVMWGLGLSLTGQEKYEQAATVFKQLADLPLVPDQYVMMAKSQVAWIDLQEKRYDNAVKVAREVLVYRNEPNGPAVNVTVDALRDQEKFADAIALLQPLAEKYPAHPLVNARLLEMLVRSGQKEKASAIAAAQVKAGTRNAIAAAEAYVNTGDYAAAAALLEGAAKKSPEEIDLRFQLGAVYERAGNVTSAEKAFLGILDEDPEHAPALNYLGYMWADRNVNVERAAEMLERAVAQEPRNGAYLDSLGWAYYRLGKFDLALRYLSQAAALVPSDATVLDHLADAYAAAGDTAKAAEVYRRALALRPDEPLKKQINGKLAEAEKKIASRK